MTKSTCKYRKKLSILSTYKYIRSSQVLLVLLLTITFDTYKNYRYLTSMTYKILYFEEVLILEVLFVKVLVLT